MVNEDVMDWIIKARADVLRANRLLAEWDSLAKRRLGLNEYSLLVNLMSQANQALDRAVTGMVEGSAKTDDTQEALLPRSRRRPTASRSQRF